MRKLAIRVTFGLVAISILAFGGYSFVYADNSCADLTGDAKDQCEKLDAQAKSYRNIINIKDAQGETLANQISSLDAEANALDLEIQANQTKLASLDSQIQTLSQRIEEKNQIIAQQKKILSEMLRSYYQDYSNDLIPSCLFP